MFGCMIAVAVQLMLALQQLPRIREHTNST
jgi:hypothetical protein